MGSGVIAPRIHYLSTTWKRMVSFIPRTLCPPGKKPGYPLDRRLDGHKAGLDAVTRHISYSYRESKPGRSARSLVAILTEQPRLPAKGLTSKRNFSFRNKQIERKLRIKSLFILLCKYSRQGRDFFPRHHVQTGSGVHPVSYPVDMGDHSPEVKWS